MITKIKEKYSCKCDEKTIVWRQEH